MNKTISTRKLNDIIRNLYKECGGEGTVWYYNDAQHWRVNRRKVFKTSAAHRGITEIVIWGKVLQILHGFGYTDWELFETAPYAANNHYSPLMVGIKKYEKNCHYR